MNASLADYGIVQPGKFSLTREQLADLHTNGYAGPFTLFTPEEMAAHWKRVRLELFDRRQAVYKNVARDSGVFNYDRHLDNTFLSEVIGAPQIVEKASSVLGPDVLCWRSEFFPKYPGDEGTDWHQADTFGGANGVPHMQWPNGSDFRGALTCWVAFTDASVETACMQFMPGTQRTMYYDESKGMHYDLTRVNRKEIGGVLRGFYGYDWRELQVDPNWKPDESQAVSVPCRAGQFILFWSTLMHASTPHLGMSKEMRLAFVSRYVPTSVRVYGEMKDSMEVHELGGTFPLDEYGTVLVSGHDDYGHNLRRTHTTRGAPLRNVNPR